LRFSLFILLFALLPGTQALYSTAYSEVMSYDDRGNIKSLDRKGLVQNGANWDYEDIDELTYTYSLTTQDLRFLASSFSTLRHRKILIEPRL
jgi:hypothetical protein